MGHRFLFPSKRNDANGCCQRPNSLCNPTAFLYPAQCRGTTFNNATRTVAQQYMQEAGPTASPSPRLNESIPRLLFCWKIPKRKQIFLEPIGGPELQARSRAPHPARGPQLKATCTAQSGSGRRCHPCPQLRATHPARGRLTAVCHLPATRRFVLSPEAFSALRVGPRRSV